MSASWPRRRATTACSCLRTNTRITPLQAVLRYRDLIQVEEFFRTAKALMARGRSTLVGRGGATCSARSWHSCRAKSWSRAATRRAEGSGCQGKALKSLSRTEEKRGSGRHAPANAHGGDGSGPRCSLLAASGEPPVLEKAVHVDNREQRAGHPTLRRAARAAPATSHAPLPMSSRSSTGALSHSLISHSTCRSTIRRVTERSSSRWGIISKYVDRSASTTSV